MKNRKTIIPVHNPETGQTEAHKLPTVPRSEFDARLAEALGPLNDAERAWVERAIRSGWHLNGIAEELAALRANPECDWACAPASDAAGNLHRQPQPGRAPKEHTMNIKKGTMANFVFNRRDVLADREGSYFFCLSKTKRVAEGFVRYFDGQRHCDEQVCVYPDGRIETMDGFPFAKWVGDWRRISPHPVQ
jgi:hypothetical protein